MRERCSQGCARARRALALCAVLAFASPAGPARAAPDWETLSQSARGASDEAAVSKIARELDAALPPADAEDASTELDAGARVFGELVGRAQELALSPAALEALVALGGRLGDRLKARRALLEARAGDDEAKLEALYRSDTWRDLGGSQVEVSFWLGWAQLARADSGLDDDARAAALAEAERAFSRAARALAFPDRAVRSLLGLGITRRERGDLAGARRSLERLLAQRAVETDPALADRVRYELALTAIDALDLSRGQELADGLRESNALTPAQELTLEARQVRAWVRLSRRQTGEQAQDAGSEAALILRRMLSRGGRDADLAARLIARFAGDLAGRDLGALGALLEADRAFQAGDCERALAAYAVALGQELPDEVDLAQARLRAASCKARTGHGDEAMQDLESLLAGDLAGAQRVEAARLLQSLAESAYRSSHRKADLARVDRAARLLLEVQPQGEGADLARYRRAMELSRRGRRSAALSLLAEIPEDSASYPAALSERIRLEAEGLEAKRRASGSSGPERDPALRAAAARLARHLDEAGALRERGDLPPDPAQETATAVLRCQAALLAGEDLESVEGCIGRARKREGLGEAAEQELLGVEIDALVAAKKIDRVVSLLEARDAGSLRREFPVWQARLGEMGASPEASGALPGIYARLLEIAPEASRGELRLGRIEALRRAGRGDEAVALARDLTKDEPEWGDAWVALARSLDASGEREAAGTVWRRVGGGASPGSHAWWEARLSLYDATLAGDEPEKACGWLEAGKGLAPVPGLERRIERARARCAPAGS